MTKASQSLKTQKSPKTPRTPKSRHKGQEKIYPRVVNARVTDQEWSTIQLRSDQAGLSMSRYLVEAGLREKPPVTLAERARLQFLLYQFHRAATCINQVATDRLVIAVGGSDTRQLLQEVFALLEQLAQELIRRIEETNSHDTKRMP
ncbi:hypothetical protein [Armatimonas sp.]|uniref:plasmid mobilization protein n=1 Tax=Armatimonas sp. TaxID=1872638 RepID=UPI00286B1F82|nr:hypothetical protein [Armatimonas sp.]